MATSGRTTVFTPRDLKLSGICGMGHGPVHLGTFLPVFYSGPLFFSLNVEKFELRLPHTTEIPLPVGVAARTGGFTSSTGGKDVMLCSFSLEETHAESSFVSWRGDWDGLDLLSPLLPIP